MTEPDGQRRDGTWVIALAACLWGTSALLRDPLAQRYDAPTVVFFEHLVIVVLLLPWLAPAVRAWRGSSVSAKLATAIIGGGSSALATTLFTASFRLGDPVTPQVLQKLQPVIAIALGALLLRERLRPRFGWFVVPALAGAWMMSFPDPLQVSATNLQAAALAVGAAALWAAGTVLGRFAGVELAPTDVTVMRFVFGLPAALLIALVMGAPLSMEVSDAPRLVGLALVPGVIALTIYYRGLRTTPAARATLAELMFPATAALVGVAFLGARLDTSQWAGFAIVVVGVTSLALFEQSRRGRDAETTVSPGLVPAP